MRRMTLGNRMFLTCGALTFMTLLLALVTLMEQRQIVLSTEQISKDAIPSLLWSGRIRAYAKEPRARMTLHFASTDPRFKVEMESALEQDKVRMADALRQYEILIVDREDRDLFNRVSQSYERFLETWPRGPGAQPC